MSNKERDRHQACQSILLFYKKSVKKVIFVNFYDFPTAAKQLIKLKQQKLTNRYQ